MSTLVVRDVVIQLRGGKSVGGSIRPSSPEVESRLLELNLLGVFWTSHKHDSSVLGTAFHKCSGGASAQFYRLMMRKKRD